MNNAFEVVHPPWSTSWLRPCLWSNSSTTDAWPLSNDRGSQLACSEITNPDECSHLVGTSRNNLNCSNRECKQREDRMTNEFHSMICSFALLRQRAHVVDRAMEHASRLQTIRLESTNKAVSNQRRTTSYGKGIQTARSSGAVVFWLAGGVWVS